MDPLKLLQADLSETLTTSRAKEARKKKRKSKSWEVHLFLLQDFHWRFVPKMAFISVAGAYFSYVDKEGKHDWATHF